MDTIIQFITDHATHAHWLIFGALILAGLNIPVSEDLMIIISAVLAATVVPENVYILFIFVFMGCYLSDWMVYWMGRLLGRRLWEFRWFARTFKKKRLYQTQRYFAKYGFLTLLVGRFIPFGVRNCLFLTAGMGKMRFGKFLIADGIACVCSNTLLFTLAYTLGKNYHSLVRYIKTFNIFIFSAFVVTLIAFIWYKRKKKVRTVK